ncbi:MAG: hypothetical protein NVSMB18_12480 [Acetobacteraceae bacterium]
MLAAASLERRAFPVCEESDTLAGPEWTLPAWKVVGLVAAFVLGCLGLVFLG